MTEDLERLSVELREIADEIAAMKAEEIKAQGPARLRLKEEISQSNIRHCFI